jgi:DNA-binding MarR family transcriptional regulator
MTIACIDSGDRHLFNQFSLTAPCYFSIKRIHENPGVSLTTLIALILIDKNSTTCLIRNINEQGSDRRPRSESERPIYYPHLSYSGKQLFQRASSAHNTYTQDRFSDLDIDVDALGKDLEVIIHSQERELKRVE